MPRIPGLRRALRLPGRRAVARDVDEEFALHLDLRERDLVAAGWPPETARQEALRRFGDVDDARAYCRAMDERRERRTMRLARLASLWHDLALAARALRRAPGLTLAAVLTLALGVGANVAMLGIVDRLLLRPPAHVAEPDRLRRLYFTLREDGESSTDASMSYPQYLALGEGLRPVGPTAAFYDVELVLGEGEAARRGRVTLATASFWPTLGARPALGRVFTAQEDAAPSGARVAVIGHALWASAYGGAADVVGRTLVVSGQRFEIVGVAPRGFTGVGPERVDAWVPLAALGQEVVGKYVEDPWHQARNIGWLKGVARLGPTATLPAAEQRASAAFRRALEARWGAARADSLRPRAALEPLLVERGPDRTPSARIAVWLAGMSLLVLLIACANVANLLLARALARRRETAVRVALGAGRGRIVSQLLAEGMLLAALGGAAALGVAHVGGRLVSRLLVPDVDWTQGVADPRALALAAATVLVTGLLTAVVPAAQASAVELVPSLRAGAREGGGRRSRARSALVVVQAALSLVLLVGAGLFVRSLDAARRVELGFAPGQVLRVHLDVTGTGLSREATVALYDRLRDRLARLPGIAAASVGMTEPFATTIDYRIGIPGRDSLRLPPSGAPRANAVSPEYLATVGTRLLAGRGFTDGDRRGGAPVMLVNQTMARTLWPGRSPIGDRVCVLELQAKPCFDVVGVTQDARWQSLRAGPTMQMYLPLAQEPSGIPLRVLYLRTAGEPSAMARAVREAVRLEAPQVPFVDVAPLAANLEPQLRPWRLGATVFTLFGAVALVLAALGLYAVIAYDVAQRLREMGVRLALGARARDVLWLVVGDGVRVASVGIGLGAVAALVAARWLAPLLFDAAGARDPLVLGLVALTLLGVAVLASLVPAWRATRVPPGVALRAE